MKSKMLIVMMGVFIVFTSVARMAQASQVPKIQAPAQTQMLPQTMVKQAKPVPKMGMTTDTGGKVGRVGPLLKYKGIKTIDPSIYALIQEKFEAANPNDYDGDGIPNDVDTVCQDDPHKLVMLTRAQSPNPYEYIYTVDEEHNLSSDVVIDNFLLRYVLGGSEEDAGVTLMSYYNPNQTNVDHNGDVCVWPPYEGGKNYRTVQVSQDRWRRISNICGDMIVRAIYYDSATDSVILQFARLTQIPEACMHPHPSQYTSVDQFQNDMQILHNSPKCKDLQYVWDSFSQYDYRKALENNYPVGCPIDFPIEEYTGPTHGPCFPQKSCIEANGNCASVGFEGDCSDMTNCCTQPLVK